MAFFKNINQKHTEQNDKSLSRLISLYQQTQGLEDCPFSLARQTFDNLENTAESHDELMGYILEDIIFASLYATFYEQILITVRVNPDVAIKLITIFDESSVEREQLISEQTENHINYITNNGFCKGCQNCQNHRDLDDLIEKWSAHDDNFFINLYLGMQTIQNSMEQLVYDFLIDDNTLFPILTIENIINYRKYIYEDTQDKIKELR